VAVTKTLSAFHAGVPPRAKEGCTYAQILDRKHLCSRAHEYVANSAGARQSSSICPSRLRVFSTGFNARVPIDWVPQQYGEWSVNADVQYYNLINSQLRNAQSVIGVVSPGSSGYRNVFVFAAGLGFHF
jgi:hypothetical protein